MRREEGQTTVEYGFIVLIASIGTVALASGLGVLPEWLGNALNAALPF